MLSSRLAFLVFVAPKIEVSSSIPRVAGFKFPGQESCRPHVLTSKSDAAMQDQWPKFENLDLVVEHGRFERRKFPRTP